MGGRPISSLSRKALATAIATTSTKQARGKFSVLRVMRPGYSARIGESPDRPLKLKLSIGEIWSRLKGKERFSEEPQGLARTRLVEKAAWLAVECAGASQTSVGSYFNLGQGAISAGLKRLALNFDKNPENRKRLLTWAKSLKD